MNWSILSPVAAKLQQSHSLCALLEYDSRGRGERVALRTEPGLSRRGERESFRKSDFFETREGVCRLMPPLTIPSGNKRLIGAGSRSSTEPVAQKLFASARATVKTSLEVGNAENTSLADTPNREQLKRGQRAVSEQAIVARFIARVPREREHVVRGTLRSL